MTDDNAGRITDFRQQWQQLPKDEKIARIQRAVAATAARARQRRIALTIHQDDQHERRNRP